MNRAQVEALWRQAQARQLLPADAQPPMDAVPRPWPVVALTAVGAWLAAVPLLAVLGLAFGPMFQHGGAYFAGLMLLLAAVVILRSSSLPLFVEQLAVPLLLTGGASLGFALFQDMRGHTAPAVLALLSLVIGGVVRPHWLKACLGAAAAFFTAAAFWPSSWGAGGSSTAVYWLSWQLCAGAWLAAGLWERAVGLRSAWVALVSGWAVMSLLGLALSSGMAMLVGGGAGWGSVGGSTGEHARAGLAWPGWPGLVSMVLALLAAAWLGHALPSLRRLGYVGVAAVLAGLAAFMPALGAVLLILAGCLVQLRWQLAGAAALTAAWVISSFYYQLAWPLATKAEVLAVAGTLLAMLAWPLWHRPGTAALRSAAGHLGPRVGAVVSLAAVLAVINVAIAQKEALIAEGQVVFVPLAPADPRSLIQGDFMRLNFALPREAPEQAGGLLSAARPSIVATLDERRIARVVRLHDGTPLASGELLIELTPKDGRWTVVTDAWFFREGEAARWRAARFGEFRVKPGGQALLVGLRGAELGPL
jgi:uncharacterized membrane-anchored protein